MAPQLVLVAQHGSGAEDAGGGLVACATLALDEPPVGDAHAGGGMGGGMHVARLTDVVVDAAWRGRGVGRALVRAAVRHAGHTGCSTIRLSCSPRLVPFYSKCGLEQRALEPPPPGGSAAAGQGAVAGAAGTADAAPVGEVGEAEAGEAEARCLWCAGQNAESEGGERLLLCDGDEGHCFCAACVVHALGAKELQRVEQRSPWLCFKCASALKVAAAQCQALALLTARRLAALGSSALPGRGPATGLPATAAWRLEHAPFEAAAFRACGPRGSHCVLPPPGVTGCSWRRSSSAAPRCSGGTASGARGWLAAPQGSARSSAPRPPPPPKAALRVAATRARPLANTRARARWGQSQARRPRGRRCGP